MSICYSVRIGTFVYKRRLPFIEAEHIKKKLDHCVYDVVITAERE